MTISCWCRRQRRDGLALPAPSLALAAQSARRRTTQGCRILPAKAAAGGTISRMPGGNSRAPDPAGLRMPGAEGHPRRQPAGHGSAGDRHERQRKIGAEVGQPAREAPAKREDEDRRHRREAPRRAVRAIPSARGRCRGKTLRRSPRRDCRRARRCRREAPAGGPRRRCPVDRREGTTGSDTSPARSATRLTAVSRRKRCKRTASFDWPIDGSKVDMDFGWTCRQRTPPSRPPTRAYDNRPRIGSPLPDRIGHPDAS